jgi:type IV pilus assembly protein PilM
MRNLSAYFSPKSSYLGIDLGTASIKVVELTRSGRNLKLVNYGMLETRGHLERINDSIQTSSLEIMDSETAELLSTLLDKMKTSTKEVYASLPSFSVFTSLLELPDMAIEETAQAMQYQAKALVPMPINEVSIDWMQVERYKNNEGRSVQKIVLMAVPKRQIEKYQKIFRQAGLNLKVLELETVSLARILTRGDPTLTLIVDIGARSTAFSVARNGMMVHSGQADFASSSLTHALSRGLSISVLRAEELKKQKGLLGTGGEYEVSTLMLPYLDVIINEARRVIEGYEKSHQEKIDRIILSGGGASLLGIEKYITNNLKLPTVKADPFSAGIEYSQDLTPTLKSIAPALSVALGLGIKPFQN